MTYSTAMAYSTAPMSNSAVGIRPESDPEWSPDLDPDDLRELKAAQDDPTKVVAKLPKESTRLGYYSTLCLISNRLIGRSRRSHPQTKICLLTGGISIGTGVFNSASVVFPNTQSIGLALILWVCGAIFALAGTVVYIELGLTIPRWQFGPNGEKISTPRSGDALNYVCVHNNTLCLIQNLTMIRSSSTTC
jgi:hypothetical protein